MQRWHSEEARHYGLLAAFGAYGVPLSKTRGGVLLSPSFASVFLISRFPNPEVAVAIPRDDNGGASF